MIIGSFLFLYENIISQIIFAHDLYRYHWFWFAMKWITLRRFSMSAKQSSYLGTAVKLAEEKVSDIRGLPIIHHPRYVCDLPPKHRFPMPKFQGILNHLIKDGVVQPSKQVRKEGSMPL